MNECMTSVHKKAIKIAADAATRAHYGKFRKDNKTPVIVHPKRVAERVKFFGGNHICIISAWLHDVMEDCDEGENIIRNTLLKIELPQQDREEIFAIVSALTKNPDIKDKSEKLADSLKRINKAPPQAILVKLCDRMDNLMDEQDRDPQFLSDYLPSTDQLIDALSDGAKKYGYIRALERLIELRKKYSVKNQ
jgi:(p)ppGpp synthase/HD superfamily hydrolase